MGEVSDEAQRAINAIRQIDKITCADIAAIMACMASAMKDANFPTIDLNTIDETMGFICGETA